ncbi:MAG: shikimate kinase [Vulcanimicrobiaceae bacterium]
MLDRISLSDRIFLCGLSGSGKSTVAPLLAQLRGCTALDTDAIIVSEAAVPISEIFRREGESGFREREARAVQLSCAHERAVIALGGGALERDDSFEAVCASGTLIFLDAPDSVLATRLERGEARPLMAQPGALGRMRARRLARFERALVRIDTSTRSPHEIVTAIANALHLVVPSPSTPLGTNSERPS